MKLLMSGIIGFGLAMCAVSAQADTYGIASGRTADVRSEPGVTVEGGLTISGEVNALGAQVAYKAAPELLVFGAITSLSSDSVGGDLGLGAGALYQMDQMLVPRIQTALKLSYHRWSIDPASPTADGLDVSALGLELVINPVEQTLLEGMEVFGSIGTRRIDAGVSSSSEIALTGGVVAPVGLGRAYATLEVVDGVLIGLGYRVALDI